MVRVRAVVAGVAVVAGAGLVAVAAPADAAGGDFIWSGAISTEWSVGGNWQGDVAPSGTVGTLTFPSGADNSVMDVDVSGLSATSLDFEDAGYDLTGDGLTLGGITVGSGDGLDIADNLSLSPGFTASVGGSDVLELDGVLSGTGDLELDGTGEVQLAGSAANTYSGGTTVKAGLISAQVQGAVGIPAGTVTAGAAGESGKVTLGFDNELASTANVSAVGDGEFDLAGTTQTAHSVAFDGGTVDSNGGQLTVTGDITSTGTSGTLAGSVDIATGPHSLAPASEGASGYDRIDVTADLSGSGSMTIPASAHGLVVLSGGGDYTGEVTVDAAALAVDGDQSGAGFTTAGGSLEGLGTLGSLSMASGSVTPGRIGRAAEGSSPQLTAQPGTLTVSGATTLSGGTLSLRTATAPGDRLKTGSLSLSGTPALSVTGSPTLPYTLINVTGADPVGGTFNGATQGSSLAGGFLDYCGGDGNNVTIDPTAPAACAGSTYELEVATSGVGLVTSDPGGIDCGSTCSAPFGSGTQVTLTPSTAAGHGFDGWDNCPNWQANDTCVVTGPTALPVKARFVSTTAFHSWVVFGALTKQPSFGPGTPVRSAIPVVGATVVIGTPGSATARSSVTNKSGSYRITGPSGSATEGPPDEEITVLVGGKVVAKYRVPSGASVQRRDLRLPTVTGDLRNAGGFNSKLATVVRVVEDTGSGSGSTLCQTKGTGFGAFALSCLPAELSSRERLVAELVQDGKVTDTELLQAGPGASQSTKDIVTSQEAVLYTQAGAPRSEVIFGKIVRQPSFGPGASPVPRTGVAEATVKLFTSGSPNAAVIATDRTDASGAYHLAGPAGHPVQLGTEVIGVFDKGTELFARQKVDGPSVQRRDYLVPTVEGTVETPPGVAKALVATVQLVRQTSASTKVLCSEAHRGIGQFALDCVPPANDSDLSVRLLLGSVVADQEAVDAGGPSAGSADPILFEQPIPVHKWYLTGSVEQVTGISYGSAPGPAPAAGVTVDLYQSDTTTVIASTTTGSDGSYVLEGSHGEATGSLSSADRLIVRSGSTPLSAPVKLESFPVQTRDVLLTTVAGEVFAEPGMDPATKVEVQIVDGSTVLCSVTGHVFASFVLGCLPAEVPSDTSVAVQLVQAGVVTNYQLVATAQTSSQPGQSQPVRPDTAVNMYAQQPTR